MELGRGQFGVTNLVTHCATRRALACKSIAKRKLLNREDVEDVRREVQIGSSRGGSTQRGRRWGFEAGEFYVFRRGRGFTSQGHRFRVVHVFQTWRYIQGYCR